MDDSPPVSSTSTLHSLFETPDVTALIADLLDEGPKDLSRRNLLAFAHTCRATADPALRMLWREQPGLDNLIRTLPPEAWRQSIEGETIQDHRGDYNDDASNAEGEGYRSESPRLRQKRDFFSLNRLLGSSEWERFDYYASFIRVLLIDDDEIWSEWSPSVFSSLHLHQSFLRRDLLPNLKEIKYSRLDTSLYTFPHILVLLPRSLQVLDILVPFNDKDKEFLQSLVSYFPHAFPEIEQIRISSWFPEACSPIDIQPFTNCTHLKSLICDLRVSNLGAAVQLAHLPKLEVLHLSFLGQRTLEGPPLTGSYKFPYVKSLTCNSSPEFLRSCRFPVLQSFSIGRMYDIRDSLNALTAHCTRDLMREIEIDTTWSHMKNPRSLLTFNEIQGLLNFHGLKRVAITATGCSVWGDGAMELMASAWPNLEELTIEELESGLSRFTTGSEMTLLALVPLVKHCPDLKSLSIKITDETPISLSDLPETNECSNLHIEEINFRESAIELCDEIAAFLSRLFPNLKRIKRQDGLLPKKFQGNWKRVEELLERTAGVQA